MAPVEPTPKDTIFRDGTAQLYRFRRQTSGKTQLPLLLVPSMINRWYVLDLRHGASLAHGMVSAGIDTWCLDWGVPNDEDRYLAWDDVLARLQRMIRRVKRETGAPKVGLLGYCMGGTLAGIGTALNPDDVAALVNLAGPFDFSKGGLLRTLVDPSCFNADAIADAGNVTPGQMQDGFLAMRPTQTPAKLIGWLDRAHDPKAREAFDALEGWASDNIPFPAAAYRTYIKDLYQANSLIKGEHYVAGKRADLGRITCPVLTICADRDTICPPAAAAGLADHCGSTDKETITVPGGHVGAVVGSRASKFLYPALASWLEKRLVAPARVEQLTAAV
jgi:polyhydroxyalkanoate synthase